MPRTAYDPFKDESLGRVPPKTRIRVDWKRGAKLLAGGEPAEAVAAALGIAEERLWRHFNRSLRFQFLFGQALERRRLTAKLAFDEAACRAVVQRCGRIEEIDGESWQWLARETGLASGDAEGNEGGEGDGKSANAKPAREARLVAALKDAGRMPPNQALRERIRKERKGMDAQFAELKAWGRDSGILPPPPEAEPQPAPEPEPSPPTATGAPQAGPEQKPAGAAKLRIYGYKAWAAENKDRLSRNKTQISTDKIQISTDTRGDDAEPPAAQPPENPAENADPAPPDTGTFQPHHYRSVIDLTDMHGNPLPGREHLLRE